MGRLIGGYNRDRPVIAIYRYGELIWYLYIYTSGVMKIRMGIIANADIADHITANSTVDISTIISALTDKITAQDISMTSVEEIVAALTGEIINDKGSSSFENTVDSTMADSDIIQPVNVAMVDGSKLAICAHPHINVVLASVIFTISRCLADISLANGRLASIDTATNLEKVVTSLYNSFITSLDFVKRVDKAYMDETDRYMTSLDIVVDLEKTVVTDADIRIVSLDTPGIFDKSFVNTADGHIISFDYPDEMEKSIISLADGRIISYEAVRILEKARMSNVNGDTASVMVMDIFAGASISETDRDVSGKFYTELHVLADPSSTDDDVIAIATFDADVKSNLSRASNDISAISDTHTDGSAILTKTSNYISASATMRVSIMVHASLSNWIYPVQTGTNLKIYQAYGATHTGNNLEVI